MLLISIYWFFASSIFLSFIFGIYFRNIFTKNLEIFNTNSIREEYLFCRVSKFLRLLVCLSYNKVYFKSHKFVILYLLLFRSFMQEIQYFDDCNKLYFVYVWLVEHCECFYIILSFITKIIKERNCYKFYCWHISWWIK